MLRTILQELVGDVRARYISCLTSRKWAARTILWINLILFLPSLVFALTLLDYVNGKIRDTGDDSGVKHWGPGLRQRAKLRGYDDIQLDVQPLQVLAAGTVIIIIIIMTLFQTHPPNT